MGDPQIKTDHPFYKGELAYSTFDQLFEHQAAEYRAATGRSVQTEHDKVLASWFWRNTHYAHGEEGTENLWGRGFTTGDLRTREYWTGLFSHGFGLCGTTHSQWTAEMQYLLGHGRARGDGVAEHNSFEVWLTGGAYGEGRWALLDHDLSTVIFDSTGQRLLSIPEVVKDWRQLTSRDYQPAKQQGWLVCGLHPGDGAVFKENNTAEYLAGYAGPPPTVYLRRGETLCRYLQPGLESGREFVFWGRNYNTAGIPGPERNHTWINQPEKMFGSTSGAGSTAGQARFGNAVFTYTPDFASQDYREGLHDEGSDQLTFHFSSPYLIAATPANSNDWGIYEPGCKNGLLISSRIPISVSLSVDRGLTWSSPARVNSQLDLTDLAKGYRQYLLRIHSTAAKLKTSALSVRTVCQANPALMPRLKDSGTTVTFAATGRATVSAGPTLPQAQAHLVAGAFNSPTVTLRLGSPKGEPIKRIYAAAHLASGNPPDPRVRYQLDLSTDGGQSWHPALLDWTIPRRGEEPPDFWSQSFCYGAAELGNGPTEILARFSNSGSRQYLRAELHAVYQLPATDPLNITFAWRDSTGDHQSTHLASTQSDGWPIATATNTLTRWIEFSPLVRR